MQYISTRNKDIKVSSAKAVLDGIASDGGLYTMPSFDEIKLDYKELMGKSYYEMARKILSVLLPDFSEEELCSLVRKAYDGKFETKDITPTVKVGDAYLLELFRGPTCAFKDVALSMLPQLMTSARGKCDLTDEISILTSTSGDTGKAAMEGFRDVEGTHITVFYPNGGVSDVQKAQMATQEGKNVSVFAINGNFDDAQTGMKEVFATASEKHLLDGTGKTFSSANSINIGRLAPQVVYYFKAYSDLVGMGAVKIGDEVDFAVPTGNFGDILSGYFAKMLGLPIRKLVCASNANDVLTEFINTGRYDRKRPFYKTISPSMDILVSSNLERLLYLLSGDCDKVADYMAKLKTDGCYEISPDLKAKIDEIFWAECCDDKAAKETIGRVWHEYGYLMDTHTAVAYNVMEKYKKTAGDAPIVVLSTASPFKFPVAVLEGMGEIPLGDEFEVMEELSEKSGLPIPKGLANLRERKVLHKEVIEKDEMLDTVLKKVVGIK